MLKAILFDLDDTLYPAEAVYRRGLQAAWRRLKKERPISWPRFRRLYAVARRETKRRLRSAPSARNRILYLKGLLERLEGRSNARLTLALMDAYHTAWRSIDPRPLRALAARLAKRYKLGIVTNQTAAFQLAKMNRIDPNGRYFSVLVTSEEMGAEKPNGAVFREACRRLGCRPSETLVVGNSWVDDVQGARRAGLYAVYLRLPGQAAALSTRVPTLRHLFDLEPFLNALFR